MTKPSIAGSKESRVREAFTGGFKMKLRKVALLPITAALVGFGSMAQASIWDGSFTNMGVNYSLSFDSLVGSTGTFTLTLDTSGYDHYPQGVTTAYLDSVDIKAWSDNTNIAFTLGSAPNGASSWTDNNGPISGGGTASQTGCGINGAGFACAEAQPKGVFNVGPSYQFVFNVTASNAADFLTSVVGAHVGAGYADSLGVGHGYGITSVTMAIPEPETYAMLLAGLGLMAFVARRRRESLGNLVPA